MNTVGFWIVGLAKQAMKDVLLGSHLMMKTINICSLKISNLFCPSSCIPKGSRESRPMDTVGFWVKLLSLEFPWLESITSQGKAIVLSHKH